MLVRLGLIGALVLGCAMFFLASLPSSLASTLTGDKDCYRELFLAPSPRAQVAILGSSRIRRGIDPDILGASLGLQDGAVINLAHPGHVPEMDYEILDVLTEPGSVLDGQLRLAVVELMPLSEDLLAAERAIDPRKSEESDIATSFGTVTQRYYLSVRWSEIGERAANHSANIVMAAWDALKLWSLRMSGHLQLAIEGETTSRDFHGDVTPDADRIICFSEEWADPVLEKQFGQPRAGRKRDAYLDFFGEDLAGTGWTDPAPEDWLSNPDFLSARNAMQDIADLGRRRGFEVVFIYLPAIATPQPSDALVQGVEAQARTPFVVPPPEIRRALKAEYWSDNTHLLIEGRDIYTRWLAGAITGAMANPLTGGGK